MTFIFMFNHLALIILIAIYWKRIQSLVWYIERNSAILQLP